MTSPINTSGKETVEADRNFSYNNRKVNKTIEVNEKMLLKQTGKLPNKIRKGNELFKNNKSDRKSY